MKETVRKNSSSLLITAGVVLAHLLILGLIVWGCSSGSDDGKKDNGGKRSGGTETSESSSGEQTDAPGSSYGASPLSALTGGGKNTAPERPLRYRKSSNPNFGRALDFDRADHRTADKFLPGLTKWRGTGIIVDMDTRKVLWEQSSQKTVPVASMTKLMTVLLVAEAMVDNSKLTLDTKVVITESAMKAVPEKMKNQHKNLKPGDTYTVRELLLCTIVISNNDAATQLAELVGGGSVEKFVAGMNRRARQLKLDSVKFYTPSGLTDRQGKVSEASAADMVLIAERLLEYPEIFEMFSLTSAKINDTTQTTTNNILSKKRGIDGMKTGFIRKSGLCLAFSVLRDGRRMIGCVTNFNSNQDRKNFTYRLIDWAYNPGKPLPKAASAKPGKKNVKRQTPEPKRSGTGKNAMGK